MASQKQESERIEHREDLSIYEWAANAVNKPLFVSQGTYLKQKKGRLLVADPTPGDDGDEDDTTPSPYSVDDAVALVLESIFYNVACNNLGPTLTSRYQYMFMFTITSAYQWVSNSKIVSGTKDGWNWDLQTPLSDKDIFVWMNHVMAYFMTAFTTVSSPPSFYPYGTVPGPAKIHNPAFDPTELLANERTVLNLTEAEQAKLWTRVQRRGNFAGWQTAWIAWYTARQADGYIAAQTPLTAAKAPNHYTDGSVQQTFIDVTVPSDISGSHFPNPKQWTELKMYSVTPTPSALALKPYYCYTFSSVSSTCLSTMDCSNISGATSAFFPSDAEREAEIADLVSLTASLTATQKMTAEFWAAGPFTISPPGMFLYLWRQVMTATQFAKTRGLKSFFASGLSLAVNLFEMGRIVWGLKKQFMQARPIQEVRRLYKGQTLTKWDGTDISGNSWVPYQSPVFVTPPFADFPSGHSAYSQIFANTMTAWFGPAIPTAPAVTNTDLGLLSPTFLDPPQNFPPTFPLTSYVETQPILSFVLRQSSSEVQPGVPSVPITLSWSTWQEVANSAGMSRQYGGIHAVSAHVASQSAANRTFAMVQSRWGFRP